MTSKARFIVVINLVVVLLAILLFANFFVPRVGLVGKNYVMVNVGNIYNDELFFIKDKGYYVDINKIDYKIDTNLDINNIGRYNYRIIINYKNKEYKLLRTIDVVDSEKPVIEIDTDILQNNICKNKLDLSEVRAYDNYDGDLTDKVIKEYTNEGINYTVTDSSKNKTTKFVDILIRDNIAPELKLNGYSSVYLKPNEEYKEPGFTATDNCDGNITTNVKVSSNLDITKVGNYTISYSVKDRDNNETIVTRKIIVNETNEEYVALKEKEIKDYITKNNLNVSVVYYDLSSHYQYNYNEKKLFFGASLIKTMAALYAYENMDINDELISLIKPAIEVSSNDAYEKLLLQKIGINNLKEYGISLGIDYSKDLAAGRYYIGTNGLSQLKLWQRLWEFINTNSKGEELKSFFINDRDRYLDFDGSPEVMHKYGYSNSWFNDVGIVLDEYPYIVIILTKEADNNYGKIINDLSKKVYELHKAIYNK